MESQIINLACFVSRLVVSNNLELEEGMLDKVIGSLTDTVGKPMSLRDHIEREQAWLDLLNANKLNHLKTGKLLKMAKEARCFRVAEHLYELQHDFSNIVSCYLNDVVRRSEVFNYIINYINISERCIQEQFLVNFKKLVGVNSKKTGEIVTEYFPDLIEQFSDMLDGDFDLQYYFLHEMVVSDIKLPPRIAEIYLEQLCIKNKTAVCNYVQLNFCRKEDALNITRKYEIHAATALLLEYGGEWTEALEILLNHDLIKEGVNLCIRGAEHLDSEGAQRLWLTLLQCKRATKNVSLRQLVHAAAPHVPPAQLLELVSNAYFGDIKALLQDILSDYTHDVQMFSITLKLLGKDLHYGLAKSLFSNGKGILVSNLTCSLCQKSLSFRKELESEQTIVVWICGHCFHSACIKTAEVNNTCPQCRIKAIYLPVIKKLSISNPDSLYSNIYRRPNLEGHF